MKSERIIRLEQLCAQRGKSKVPTSFEADYHNAALTAYAGLPLWEKTARAMAFAIENQPVFVYEGDRIGGRVYHTNEQRAPEKDPELDYLTEPAKQFAQQCPESVELFLRLDERLYNRDGWVKAMHWESCPSRRRRRSSSGCTALPNTPGWKSGKPE